MFTAGRCWGRRDGSRRSWTSRNLERENFEDGDGDDIVKQDETDLRMSMFTDPQKPWAKYSQLDCKGGEARHLLPAFIPGLSISSQTFWNTRDHAILSV